MTNREKYLDEILAAMSWGKFSGEIDHCQNHKCDDCDFETGQRSCRKEAIDWLRAEADAEPKVDWSKVPVDTRIWVRDHDVCEWEPRYFAKYEDGRVYAWSYGTTSWSVGSEVTRRNADGSITCWNYAKLAKEDDEA